MKQCFFALVFGLTAAGALPALADQNTSTLPSAYFQASEVTMTEVIPTASEIASGYLSSEIPNTFSPAALAGLDWSQMIVIGEKIIELIKEGKPVVNIKRDAVSVVPMGIQSWQQLAGWQVPVTKAYNLSVKNGFGSKVVDVRLKVSGMWGGSVDGRGKFLANVQIVPVAVKVLWGWSLDLWSENREPVNAGTVADPVAGLGFDIRYKAGTVLNELNGTQDYYITGDGKILELQ